MKFTSFVRAALFASAFSLAGSLFAGPTPYPAQADETSWPGMGPIRVGSWMTDNRLSFWPLRDAAQGSVVFVGDSLIGGWKRMNAAFPGIKVANRGIGGDVSRGVLFRFQEDVLDLHPRAVVLCAGTNDLSAHGKPDHVISNIGTMVQWAAEADPKMPFIICTLPPRNVPNAPIIEGSLESLNARLKTFAEGKSNVTVVDLYPVFVSPDGSPNPEFIAKDGIHLTPAGFEKWAALLRPVLEANGIVGAPAPAK